MTIHRLSRAFAIVLLAVALNRVAAGAVQETREPIAVAPPMEQNDDGRVFVNGVRRQDEVVVVNVRPLCGSCDAESLRNGALFVPHVDVHVFRPSDGTHRAAIGPCDAIPDLLRVDERCDVYVAEESGHMVAFGAGPRLTLVS